METKYQEIYNRSLQDPQSFWSEIANDVFWYKKPTKILNSDNPPFYKWFEDGITNTCYNAVDLHVKNGNGNKIAIIYDSPITNSKKKITYSQLKDQVSIFAGALKKQGTNKGDRVIIYMPMIPEAVIAMLACARIGAIHSVVFGGFAANELASRIDDSKAKIILSASCGYEPGRTIEYKPLLKKAIELAKHKPDKCIIYQRKDFKVDLDSKNEIDWNEAIKGAEPVECVEMKADDYAYILYTSGTTGTPKGIVRDIGGHIVALKWTMKNIYNIDPNDVWWSASDIGLELLKTKYGSACKPVPGYDIKIMKSDGKEAKPNEMGDVVVKLPLPPGTFPTLWNADQKYKENYMSSYPGFYQTYDAGHIDEDGYVWIMSRTDDIINVAGHRLSTGAMEEVLAEHKDVAECAVLGIADKLKGQLPIGLLVLKAGVSKNHDEISKECIQMIREKVGPVAAFKTAIVIKRLPKTRSGKILRGTVSKIADGEAYKMPATIDDPAILDEIKVDLKKHNILK